MYSWLVACSILGVTATLSAARDLERCSVKEAHGWKAMSPSELGRTPSCFVSASCQCYLPKRKRSDEMRDEDESRFFALRQYNQRRSCVFTPVQCYAILMSIVFVYDVSAWLVRLWSIAGALYCTVLAPSSETILRSPKKTMRQQGS